MGGESAMIRLALILTLFVSLTVVSVAQADTSPSPTPKAPATATEPDSPAKVSPSDEKNSRARWIPRQARRRAAAAPAVTPYPVLIGPAGIPTLPF
jgi:hypothetical protein